MNWSGVAVMLKRFEVSNFKQFSHIILDFTKIREYQFNMGCIAQQTIKSALIYGANASGKTNLGLALFDITCHLVDKQQHLDAYHYYLNADHSDKPAEFRYDFSFDDANITYLYKKLNYNELIEEQLYIDGKEVLFYNLQTGEKRVTEAFGHLNWLFMDKKLSGLRYLANNSNLKTTSPIYKLIDFVGKMLWFRRSDDANSYMGFTTGAASLIDFIVKNDLKDDFENFLNTYGVHEKLALLKKPDGQYQLYFKHAVPIPFNATASSGTQALYLFYYWYKQIQDVSFLFIDEFDAFYHPMLAKKVLCLLRDTFMGQSILTTHNVYLMNNDVMRPDCCFIIHKDGIHSFADATTRELREGNNIGKLYLSGEFDG